MWRSWGKSPGRRVHNNSCPSSSFSCSSFKDIHTLFADEAPQQSNAVVTKTASVFNRVRLANSLLRSWPTRQQTQFEQQHSEDRLEAEAKYENAITLGHPSTADNSTDLESMRQPIISIPGAEKRIVVYFTSLRVVRSTFEDCRSVRTILRGFRVSLDERDLLMDSRFLTELQGILGRQSKLTLPIVFIGGRYIGGAEEIRYLNEIGELKKCVEGLPAVEPGVCEVCGGYRFRLCDECSGSHKLYTDKNGLKTCAACNENGLIRCPSCSRAPL